ncbi:tetratricopeptide repeat protein [Catellatospora aurea]|uniref:Tetratricopeptide repeat protein n=1 Tax=Catellatospora aurea TaxID=1337874 RepID=A0ABW2H1W2_9ACTN
MTKLDPPPAPAHLIEAVYEIFGRRCLLCAAERPLNVAHLINRRDARHLAQRTVQGFNPEQRATLEARTTSWHPGAVRRNAERYHHNLGNMVPLCANCHTLLDGTKYHDVTEDQVIRRRDAALNTPEVLRRVIGFVRAEMSGRPNRCDCAAFGRQRHSRTVDPDVLSAPIGWLSRGYRRGVIADDPYVISAPRTHCWDWLLDHLHLGLPLTYGCANRVGRCGEPPRPATTLYGELSAGDMAEILGIDAKHLYQEYLRNHDADPFGIRLGQRLTAQLENRIWMNTDLQDRIHDKILERVADEYARKPLRERAAAGDPSALYAQATQLESTNQREQAIAVYRQAAQAGSADAMLDLGVLLYEEGDHDEAESWLRTCIAAGGPSLKSRPLMAHHHLAVQLAAHGELDEAEQLYREAAQAGNHGSANNLSTLLRRRGHVKEAARWLMRAAKAGNANAAFTIGAEALKSGNRARGEAWLRRSVEDGSSLAFAVLVVELARQGRTAEVQQLMNHPSAARHLEQPVEVQFFRYFADESADR